MVTGLKIFHMTKAWSREEKDKYLKEFVQSINIVETMNECLWAGDKSHKTIYVNPIFEKLSEYSLEECIGKDCVFFFDEEGKRIIEDHHKLRPKGISSQYEATMISKSGKRIPLLISGAPTKDGGTMGIFTNLTQLKKLEQDWKFSQQIIKNSAEAVVILNKSEKILLWNAGASKIFGYSEEEVMNKTVGTIIPEDKMEESNSIMEEVKIKTHVQNIETQRKTKTGDLVDVSIMITKVTDENSKFLGYLLIYRDITQQKRINTELQKRFEAIQDAYKELGLQKRQIDYIYEITNTAASSASLSSLANLIISAVSLLTKSDGAILRLYDKEKDLLKLKACIGVSQKWLSKNQIPLKNSIAEESIKNGRPLIIDNVQSYNKHKGVKLLKSHKFSTLILIPLILPNQIIGTISLYTTDPGKFRFIETDFLENLSKICSMAINQKLCEEKKPKEKI